ncbi:MAG: MFS transporter [Bacteroidales bacterium]|nr:MFS transporter [Bacteroidales bacterium]
MSLYSYFRISKPSPSKVAPEEVESTYKRLRGRTFWGSVAGYCIFYICRMTLSVIKQPMVDEGILSPAQIGLVGSAMLFVYAVGKFLNGFIADYCNLRRFMAWGLFISALVNLVMGATGLLQGWIGFSSIALLIIFAGLWGINGWVQSMGAPPTVIGLSRWFPLSRRGTAYSIVCATPYLGKFLSMVLTGHVVLWIGWQWGFLAAGVAGLLGTALILLMISDTPESKGLPSIQEISGEARAKADDIPTRQLHKAVLRHPGIWIIAISSGFVYIAQYGISNWGIFFLQKAKDYALIDATYLIGVSEAIGVVGTVFAGWISDRVFHGDRLKPVLLCGVIAMITLGVFLFTGAGYMLSILCLSIASLAISGLYCIVAGLMAMDIVPRKATGAALGVVGISSYVAAGLQDIVSGLLIENNTLGGVYDFTSTGIFWMGACLLSFLLPALFWKQLRLKVAEF